MLFFVLINKGKSRKSAFINQKQYLPSAQQFFSRNLCSLFTSLCSDLFIVVYNSQGRFLISSADMSGLPRISGLCKCENGMRSTVSFPCNEIVCISRLVQSQDLFLFLITAGINLPLSAHMSNPAEASSK